jgi:carboxyl-terminal processing protease
MAQMNFAKNNSRKIAAWIIIAVAFFAWGFHQGKQSEISSIAVSSLTGTTSGQPANVDFSSFWKAWSIINQDYVPTATTTTVVTDQDKVWGAISGMVASLGDPYTVFFPPTESSEFASEVRGNFDGVGLEVVEQNGVLVVIAPLKGSPAANAGLKAGDEIIKIDNTDTASLSTDDAVNLIRGDAGTTVAFTVIRASVKAPFVVKVVRAQIDIPTIDDHDLGNGVYYIALYSFTENSPDLFRGALRDFVESGDSKLVLDLRGNPGGYLDAAIDMASWFLPSGDVVVRESYAPGKPETIYRSKGYNVFNSNLKLAILVDGGSASAAEILSGALSEHGVATLIGEKTFGKGSVQELVPVTSDTSLKVTIARWLTPNGVSISKQGITPQIVVDRTDADVAAGKDPQLDRAVQFLTTGK